MIHLYFEGGQAGFICGRARPLVIDGVGNGTVFPHRATCGECLLGFEGLEQLGFVEWIKKNVLRVPDRAFPFAPPGDWKACLFCKAALPPWRGWSCDDCGQKLRRQALGLEPGPQRIEV